MRNPTGRTQYSDLDPVLVTWGESRMALAATRAFGRTGLPVAVLASKSWAPAIQSRYCTEAIMAPDADDGEPYVAFLEDLVRRRRFSGLFFCDDRSALFIGRQRERFLPHVPFLLPDQAVLELTLNKTAMMNYAREHAFGFPRTAYPRNADQIEIESRDMQYPLLVKGSGGFASSHLRVADNVAEARTAFVELQVEQERSGFSEMPHLQEYVQGDVFSALTVCRHGRPVAIFMMKKLRTFPVWGGACVDAESIHDAALETVVRQLIEKLAWHGVIEIEFVRDARNGRFLLIEPSPDPNWGLDLAVASGINVPLLAWQIMQGVEPVTSQTSYRTGQRFVWFLPEGAQHVRERPGALLPMLAAALDPRVACDLRQADARPLVNWLKRTWWTLRQGA